MPLAYDCFRPLVKIVFSELLSSRCRNPLLIKEYFTNLLRITILTKLGYNDVIWIFWVSTVLSVLGYFLSYLHTGTRGKFESYFHRIVMSNFVIECVYCFLCLSLFLESNVCPSVCLCLSYDITRIDDTVYDYFHTILHTWPNQQISIVPYICHNNTIIARYGARRHLRNFISSIPQWWRKISF